MLSAIILAAGASKRLAGRVSKPLVKIGRTPVIAYSLKLCNAHPDISEIIVVTSAQNQAKIARAIRKYAFKKIKILVLGGRRRQDSVYQGLKAVSPISNWVLIHDCARPFIERKLITQVITAAYKTGAAILGVPVKATIKSANDGLLVERTVERNSLWEIQTPQVFRKDLILAAYNRYIQEDFTDDAALVEKMGKKVKIVPGSYENIKITTSEDLLLAGLIAQRRAHAI